MKDFRKADQRMADDAHDALAMQCAAHGCPNPWSVDGPMGRCCSAHAWSDRHLWPRITQEQQDAATQRAFEAAQRQEHGGDGAHRRTRPTTPEEREHFDRQFALMGTRTGGVHWAKRLLVREERGQRLTLAQREMWRTALRVPLSMRATDAKGLLIERKEASA